jgi:hypothetical protein
MSCCRLLVAICLGVLWLAVMQNLARCNPIGVAILSYRDRPSRPILAWKSAVNQLDAAVVHSVPKHAADAKPGVAKTAAQQNAAQQQLTAVVVPDLSNHTADVLPEVAKAVAQLEQQGLGKKVIAVSLYGADSRYTLGAVENAMLAKRDWPSWTYRVYHGAGVPADILTAIQVREKVIMGEQTGRIAQFLRTGEQHHNG